MLTPIDLHKLIKDNDLVEKTILLNREDFLKRAGTIDTNIYWIEKGSVKVFITDGEEERIIRFGYQNNLIVPMDSYLTGLPSEFIIRALKKSVVKVIPKWRFQQYLNDQPAGMALWVSLLEDLVIQQIEREKDLLISSPAERYNRVIKRSPVLFQEIPHRHIATYLRMSPETLSRLKKS